MRHSADPSVARPSYTDAPSRIHPREFFPVIWDRLGKLVAAERLPNAILVTGPQEIGKGNFLQAFAGELLDGDSTAAHPDFLALEARTLGGGREAIADFLARLHARPLRAACRVVLCEHVDALSPPAASLLLKALEDAPPTARILLSADFRGAVPTTIRSRALSCPLEAMSEDSIANVLARHGAPDNDAHEVVALAGGRPGLALRLLADADARARYRAWASLTIEGRRKPDHRRAFAATLDAETAAEFLTFLQSRRKYAALAPTLLRRSREGFAMLRSFVPAPHVIEYVLGDDV